MLMKVLFREYDYPGNVISGTAGSAEIVGTGTKFTELAINTALELDGDEFLGVVVSVTDDTHLTLDRKVQQSFTGAVWWADWSLFRIETGSINKKVESENAGEAGAIVFDDVDMSFYLGQIKMSSYYGQTNVVLANPVQAVFAGGIDSRKRFLIQLKAMRYGLKDPERIITSNYDFLATDTGSYLAARVAGAISKSRFVGLIDFQTLKTPAFNDGSGEKSFEKYFKVVDKLSAINTLKTELSRNEGFLNPNVIDDNNYVENKWAKRANTEYFSMVWSHTGYSQYLQTRQTNAPKLGDIINANILNGNFLGSNDLLLITMAVEDAAWLSGNGRMYYAGVSTYSSFYTDNTLSNGLLGENISFSTSHRWVDKLYNGEDIFIYENVSVSITDFDGGSKTLTGSKIVAIDGIKLIKAIIKQKWPDAVFVSNLRELDGTAITKMPIPLDYIFQLMNEFPLDSEPLDAVKSLVNMMQCYIFVDTAGNFVFENVKGWGPTGEYMSSVQTIDLDALSKFERNEFWDKLVDHVAINVKSWITGGTPGTYLEGVGYAAKVQGIKPRNPMDKDVVIDKQTLSRFGFTVNTDGTLSFSGLSTQQEMLDKYGELMAAEYLDFYGKRHADYDCEEADLSWDRLDWDIMHAVEYEGAKYFLTNIQEDIDENTGSFKMVEVEGHNYNLETVVIGKAKDEYLAGK